MSSSSGQKPTTSGQVESKLNTIYLYGIGNIVVLSISVGTW